MWSCVLEESMDEEDRSERTPTRKSAPMKSSEKKTIPLEWQFAACRRLCDRYWIRMFGLSSLTHILFGARRQRSVRKPKWLMGKEKQGSISGRNSRVRASGLWVDPGKKNAARVGRSEVADDWREWKTFIWCMISVKHVRHIFRYHAVIFPLLHIETNASLISRNNTGTATWP